MTDVTVPVVVVADSPTEGQLEYGKTYTIKDIFVAGAEATITGTQSFDVDPKTISKKVTDVSAKLIGANCAKFEIKLTVNDQSTNGEYFTKLLNDEPVTFTFEDGVGTSTPLDISWAEGGFKFNETYAFNEALADTNNDQIAFESASFKIEFEPLVTGASFDLDENEEGKGILVLTGKMLHKPEAIVSVTVTEVDPNASASNDVGRDVTFETTLDLEGSMTDVTVPVVVVADSPTEGQLEYGKTYTIKDIFVAGAEATITGTQSFDVDPKTISKKVTDVSAKLIGANCAKFEIKLTVNDQSTNGEYFTKLLNDEPVTFTFEDGVGTSTPLDISWAEGGFKFNETYAFNEALADTNNDQIAFESASFKIEFEPLVTGASFDLDENEEGKGILVLTGKMLHKPEAIVSVTVTEVDPNASASNDVGRDVTFETTLDLEGSMTDVTVPVVVVADSPTEGQLEYGKTYTIKDIFVAGAEATITGTQSFDVDPKTISKKVTDVSAKLIGANCAKFEIKLTVNDQSTNGEYFTKLLNDEPVTFTFEDGVGTSTPLDISWAEGGFKFNETYAFNEALADTNNDQIAFESASFKIEFEPLVTGASFDLDENEEGKGILVLTGKMLHKPEAIVSVTVTEVDPNASASNDVGRDVTFETTLDLEGSMTDVTVPVVVVADSPTEGQLEYGKTYTIKDIFVAGAEATITGTQSFDVDPKTISKKVTDVSAKLIGANCAKFEIKLTVNDQSTNGEYFTKLLNDEPVTFTFEDGVGTSTPLDISWAEGGFKFNETYAFNEALADTNNDQIAFESASFKIEFEPLVTGASFDLDENEEGKGILVLTGKMLHKPEAIVSVTVTEVDPNASASNDVGRDVTFETTLDLEGSMTDVTVPVVVVADSPTEGQLEYGKTYTIKDIFVAGAEATITGTQSFDVDPKTISKKVTDVSAKLIGANCAKFEIKLTVNDQSTNGEYFTKLLNDEPVTFTFEDGVGTSTPLDISWAEGGFKFNETYAFNEALADTNNDQIAFESASFKIEFEPLVTGASFDLDENEEGKGILVLTGKMLHKPEAIVSVTVTEVDPNASASNDVGRDVTFETTLDLEGSMTDVTVPVVVVADSPTEGQLEYGKTYTIKDIFVAGAEATITGTQSFDVDPKTISKKVTGVRAILKEDSTTLELLVQGENLPSAGDYTMKLNDTSFPVSFSGIGQLSTELTVGWSDCEIIFRQKYVFTDSLINTDDSGDDIEVDGEVSFTIDFEPSVTGVSFDLHPSQKGTGTLKLTGMMLRKAGTLSVIVTEVTSNAESSNAGERSITLETELGLEGLMTEITMSVDVVDDTPVDDQLEFGKTYKINEISIEGVDATIQSTHFIVRKFPTVTRASCDFTNDLHTSCIVTLFGEGLDLEADYTVKLEPEKSFDITFGATTNVASVVLALGFSDNLDYGTEYAVLEIKKKVGPNIVSIEPEDNEGVTFTTGNKPSSGELLVSSSSSDTSTTCGSDDSPCGSLEGVWNIVQTLQFTKAEINLKNTVKFGPAIEVSDEMNITFSNASSSPPTLRIPEDMDMGEKKGAVDVSGSLNMISLQIQLDASSSSFVFIHASHAHLTLVSCIISGHSASKNEESHVETLCEWKTGVLQLIETETTMTGLAMKELSQGAIFILNGTLLIESSSFEDNAPLNVDSHPSARRNIFCTDEAEITIDSLSDGDGSSKDRPHFWMNLDDCTLTSEVVPEHQTHFVPTLSENSTSEWISDTKTHNISIVGAMLIPCGLELEVFEKKKDGTEGKHHRVAISSENGATLTETSIVLPIPHTTLTEAFDKSRDLHCRLVYGKEKRTSTSFDLASSLAKSPGGFPYWIIVVVVVCVACVAAAVAVLIVCYVRANRKKDRLSSYKEMSQELDKNDELDEPAPTDQQLDLVSETQPQQIVVEPENDQDKPHVITDLTTDDHLTF
ncbi:hypothetical protein BLNAU_9028 [Blattamonas nauphoetae]|uniref:Uncharacterized protein n=1 Tax=Blattamonas nauphoetae TaxID=2049346 RepID=A0ABQ9XX33_9EUKA|nr:hypothetical protein BLNAU_9028 [Blattamonas nauphoetae]